MSEIYTPPRASQLDVLEQIAESTASVSPKPVYLANKDTGAVDTPMSRGAGVVDTNTQRVTLASDGPSVASLTAINAKTPALQSGAVPVTGPLTDTQLRATPVNMLAATRVVLGGERVTVPTSSATLASLMTGAAFPVGTVAVEVQADGGAVRITRASANTPTATVGYRLDDGMEKFIDTTPTNIKVMAPSSGAFLNVVCFDRV